MYLSTHHRQNLLSAIALWLLIMVSGVTCAAEVVGSVILAKGVVTAAGAGSPPRTLAKGSEVNKGETISTASDSFVVVTMLDGSKITLRPRSEVTLEAYSEEPGAEEAL